MAIVPIDLTTVAVDTYSDLKTVLQDTGSAYTAITTVCLFADIQLTSAGIDISRTRSEITLDGADPYTPGVTHTITDYYNQSATPPIGVRSTSTTPLLVRYRNLNWIGYNYFGICYVGTATGYQNVTVILSNINYSGPQIMYHRNGLVRFLDCTIDIVQGYSDPQEVAELNRVEFGGRCVINHTDPLIGDSMFWFINSSGMSPYFTVLPYADVTFNTSFDVFYSDAGYFPITISEYASLSVNTMRGMFRYDGMMAQSVLVDTGATLSIVRGGNEPVGVSTFICNNEFVVNEGATVYMQANFDYASVLLRFNSYSAALRLNNPRDFAMYSSSAHCLTFLRPTTVEINAQQINYWTSRTPFISAGTINDVPEYSWRKSTGELAHLTATAIYSGTTIDSHNFTSEELEGKPLSVMQLQDVPAFSVGNLPLTVDRIIADGRPVTGTSAPGAYVATIVSTFSYDTFALDTGYYSLNAGVIPAETMVTVRSNIPFLISSYDRASEDEGELELLDVPEEMYFGWNVVASVPVTLYGRQNPAWQLTVSDGRVDDLQWYLYAHITGPLTSVVNPNHTVPDALVFVDENDQLTVLDDTPILVFTGPGNGGEPLVTPVFWAAAQGILVQSVPHTYFNGEIYKAPIAWTLSDVPL